jgi:16S rRNA (guanine527-N7)-methyltransferase
MHIIQKYFTDLSAEQIHQFAQLSALYKEWNEKINVISRKDEENLLERHVLHSLSIAKVMPFLPGSLVLDVGTGGGFPGIPLAILFPNVEFHLVDSIGKKIKVVNEVKESLGLLNVLAEQARVETLQRKYDFVVSRAVTRLPELYKWVQFKFLKESKHELKNGILCLKGGDLIEEIGEMNTYVKTWPIQDFFEEEFFETKKVVYTAAK